VSYASEVLADSPLGFWTLSETSGTFADQGSGASAGTLTGTANARGIDTPLGTATGIDLPNTAWIDVGTTLNGSIFTMEILYRTVKTGNVIFADSRNGATGGFYIGLKDQAFNPGDGYPETGWTSSTTYIGRRFTYASHDNNWHHMVGVWNGGGGVASTQFKVYLNGAQRDDTAQSTGAATAPMASAAIRIGGSRDWTQSVGSIQIAGFAVYSSALSAGRIAAHAAAAIPRVAQETIGDAYGTQQTPFTAYGESTAAPLTPPTTGQIWPRSNWA